jgi:hypothetical protein
MRRRHRRARRRGSVGTDRLRYRLRHDLGALARRLRPSDAAARQYARKHLNVRQIEKDYRDAGIVVNTDNRVPIDESGPCYKPARQVVECVVNAGLAQIEYELLPLTSLKSKD